MNTQKFSRSATAKHQPPVCIGDISGYRFSVSVNEQTGFVAKTLRNNPKLPGVLLYDEENFIGMIPRQTIFERLGRRYGVELFLSKSISVLYKELRVARPLVLKGEMRVDDAVQCALSRDDAHLYDPVVVIYAGEYRLLDMHSLITVQANMLENLNTVAAKLNNCGVVAEYSEEASVEKIMDALREVVPFHDAGLFTKHQISQSLYIKGEKFIHSIPKEIQTPSFYQTPETFNQIICRDDLHGVLLWEDIAEPTKADPKAWMGVPLANDDEYLGVLSLCRYAHTPFSINEKELTSNYAWYLGKLMRNFITGDFGRRRASLSANFRLQKNKYFSN